MGNKPSKYLRLCQFYPLQHRYVPVTFNYQELDNRGNSEPNQNANLGQEQIQL